jgi:DNA ligase 1
MTEKMDGVRAYWNGQSLLSRHGKLISCPRWFTEGLPKGRRLDGELWMGRGSFEKLRGVINSSLEGDGIGTLWKEEIKYVLFDMVDSELPYEERMEELRRLTLPSFVSVVEVEECRGNDHLNDFLQSIVRNNGEGVVLTKPQSRYVGGRLRVRLKVKVPILWESYFVQVHDESDVRLLAIVPNGLYCLQ